MGKKELNRDKKIGTAVIAIMVVLVAAAWIYVGIPMVRLIRQPEVFRDWVDSHGVFGRISFVLMVIFQIIIAVIPGEPFELAAGYAFGAVEGTVLCILASFLGSMIVFMLVRRYGMRLVRLFFTEEKIESLRFLKTSRKRAFLFFIIFMIPGTPKDLLGYYAGLTDMSIGTWAFISFFGRLPSLLTSTLGGDAMGDSRYGLAAGILCAAVLLSGAGALIYGKIGRDENRQEDKRNGCAQRRFTEDKK
ncbi:MAG: TVP38/TMEM64 family protein [Firmicutes bacterium]|nr:TVP38/TMEM64 family protein [Bacillota bacterium]